MASVVSLLAAAVHDHVLAALDAAGLPGLRVTHGYVVQRLLDGPSTATQIAADLGVSQQVVSKWISELQAHGYVAATIDPADRRRRSVELTEHGRLAVEITRRARAAFEARLSAICGADDVDIARRVLIDALDLFGATDAVRDRRARPLADPG